MAKFRCWGKVVGTKYIGIVEAKDAEEAELKAFNHDNAHVSMCHECSDECSDPEVVEVEVEEVVDSEDGS